MKKSISFIATTNTSRLDFFLLQVMPEFSRAQIQKLIVDGHVTVNKAAAKASQKVKNNDNILVKIPEPKKTSLTAEAIPLEILFEDRDLIVINKAAGLVVSQRQITHSTPICERSKDPVEFITLPEFYNITFPVWTFFNQCFTTTSSTPAKNPIKAKSIPAFDNCCAK